MFGNTLMLTINISAATIYIYHENKEDLLYKTYLKIKDKMSEKMFQGVDHAGTVYERFEAIIRNYVDFIQSFKPYFLFLEQIMNSPLPQKWCLEDTASQFQPIYEMFDAGIRQGILKKEDTNMLVVYSILPIAELVKAHLKNGTILNSNQLDSAIKMSWDAIKAQHSILSDA